MKNPTQPNSDGTTPKPTNTEALSILAGCLAQSFQANREWEKFARGLPDQHADQQAELAALKAAEAWLDALPQPVEFAHQDGRISAADREAYALIRSLISEGHENNYERSKSADTDDEIEAIENESRALDRLNVWLNAREGKGK